MPLELTVLRDVTQPGLPTDAQFERWAAAALRNAGDSLSLAIRIVDEEESRRLNQEYRGRNAATNVLSFAADLPDQLVEDIGFRPLGDLAICANLVEAEARFQGKSALHHWAHLTVHGVLHLLGHDHDSVTTAEAMEACERRILEEFDMPDPYRSG